MTRKPIVMIMVMMIAALTGCSPDGKETPSPQPTVYTPTPTPSPQWTTEEQGAIDAVQKYLTVWTDISQNLGTADWDTINDVASDPAVNNAVTLWFQWNDNHWHLFGAPTLEVDRVAQGATDYQGTRYHVHGCYISIGSYLLDADGNPLPKQASDRTTVNYLVLHILNPKDVYLVLEDTMEGNAC